MPLVADRHTNLNSGMAILAPFSLKFYMHCSEQEMWLLVRDLVELACPCILEPGSSLSAGVATLTSWPSRKDSTPESLSREGHKNSNGG
jgi:hypothetical protein